MVKNKDISQQNFEKLLAWLDSDREIAGQKYEKIRLRLITVFERRGCFIADELADETINRVIKKIKPLEKNYEGDPSLYFYAVGKNVLSEFFKKPFPEDLSPNVPYQEDEVEEESEVLKCLRNCLQTLTKEQHSFIINYYKKDKQEKIKERKRLAEERKATGESLRTKAFRIRIILQRCIERCLTKK